MPHSEPSPQVGRAVDGPAPEQVDAWVELAELIQDPEFRATMRRMIEFNAADRGPDVPAGSSLWFMSRLVRLAGDALREGVAPDSPRAAGVLRALIGDADPAAVLERLAAATNPASPATASSPRS
ncbi:DNA-binding transcriptional MerR regulator OS=Streptomyces griseomycini OX=66895 GN=FHS37_007045 PE=4 SV=1 [Streptomyces griseomycini]